MDPFEDFYKELEIWTLEATTDEQEEMTVIETLLMILGEVPDEMLLENLSAVEIFLMKEIAKQKPQSPFALLNDFQRALVTLVVVMRAIHDGDEPEGIVG